MSDQHRFRSVPAVYRPDKNDDPYGHRGGERLAVGEYCWHGDRLYIHPPTDGEVDAAGESLEHSIRALTIGTGGWANSGTREEPFITPSIGCGIDCAYWHGYLQDGEFRACE